MPDDDDRPSDASSAADASWADVSAPDDISALVADIEAYHRELRRGRRQAWRARTLSRPGVLPLSIVSIAIVLAGVVATLLTVLAPSRSSNLAQRPLDTTHTARVGAVGGLLPQVKLVDDSGTVQSISLRPSVIAVLPVGCNCTALLNKLSGQAFQVGYPLNIVAPARTDTAALEASLDAGRPQVLVDSAYPATPAQSLYGETGATGLTLLLVRADGVIFDAFPNVTGVLQAVNADLVRMNSD